jgi:hypothetical protein
MMKKLLVIFFVALMGTQFAASQEVGIRVGDVVGGNAAIDLAWGFKTGRIHADVSFGDGVGVEALYDFLFNEIGSGFHYYVGAGGYAVIGDPFHLGAVAEGGIEYRFEGAPVALGLDWRPSFQILDNTDFYVGGFGFNARWVFGSK